VKSRSYRPVVEQMAPIAAVSQFTEDNAEPFFLPGINSLCQFIVPPNHPQVACANHTYVG